MDSESWRLQHVKHDELCLIMNKEEIRIGRSKHLDLPSKNIHVSRNHAVFCTVNGKLYVKDNNSANGTYVNKSRICPNELTQLFEDDEIGLGIHSQLNVSTPNVNNNNFYCADLIFIIKRTKKEKQMDGKHTNDCIISDDEGPCPSINITTNDFVNGLALDDTSSPPVRSTSLKSNDNCKSNESLLRILEESQFEDAEMDKNLDEPVSTIKKEPVEKNKCNYTVQDDFIFVSDDENIHYSQLMDGNYSNVGNDMYEVDTIKIELQEMDSVPYGTVFGRYVIDEIESPEHNNILDCSWVNENLEQHDEDKISGNNEVSEQHISKVDETLGNVNEQEKEKSSNGPIINNTFEHLEDSKNSHGADKAVEKNSHVLKRKHDDKDKFPFQKIKTSVFYDENKHASKVSKVLEKDDNSKKQKLKDIALRDKGKKKEREVQETCKVPAAKKIKTSDGRGKFLTENIELPSTSTNNKPIIRKCSVKLNTFKMPQKKTIPIIAPHVEKRRLRKPNPVKGKVDNLVVKSLESTIDRRRQELDCNEFYNNKIMNKFHGVVDIIHRMLLWNPVWFAEYRHHPDWGVPIVNSAPLQMMPRNFPSYDNYYDIVIPQMMVELWYFFFKESDPGSDPRKKKFLGFLTDEKKIISGTVTILQFYTVIDKQQNDKHAHVKEEDLVIIQYFSRDPGNRNKCNYFLGVVIKCNKTFLQPNDHIKEQFKNRVTISPLATIHFEVMIKIRKENAKLSEFCEIRVVTSITATMRIFKSVKSLNNSSLRDHILYPTKELYSTTVTSNENFYFKEDLNDSQKKAVAGACYVCQRSQPGIYLIQGPPGTGKTTVILNILQQIVFHRDYYNQKCVLVVAPSNGAVDELAIRIIALKHTLKAENRKLKLVRCGLRNMIHPSVQKYSTYELAKRNLHEELMHTLTSSNRELLQSKLEAVDKLGHLAENKDADSNIRYKFNVAKVEYDRTCRRVVGRMYNEQIRKHEERLLKGAQIICTTLSSCVGLQMEEVFGKNLNQIGCCIIDEATQSNEQETLIPLILGVSKIILVGDPKQLPAVTQAKEAKDSGYGESLFSRIMSNFPDDEENPVQLLNMQYRMHPEISQFPNQAFYNGYLQDSSYIKKRRSIFKDLHPYLVFNFDMETIMNSQEYSNKAETLCVLKLLHMITKQFKMAGNYNIGVITPYNNQKAAILEKLKQNHFGSNITVNTVDSFQGQEKDIIIMSCVRENTNTFLRDEQRLNVALTRARHALYIVGTSNLFRTCHVFGRIRDDAYRRKLFIKVNYHTTESELGDYILKTAKKTKVILKRR